MQNASAHFRRLGTTGFMSNQFSKYLLIRFRDGGRDASGCDCWGLIRLVYKREFNIDLPDYKISCLDAKLIDGAIDVQRPLWRRIKTPQAPCIVLMRNHPYDPTICNHFGVYVGNDKFLHTSRGTGAMITRLTDPRWLYKIEGFYVPKT